MDEVSKFSFTAHNPLSVTTCANWTATPSSDVSHQLFNPDNIIVPLYRFFFEVTLAPYESYNVHTCTHIILIFTSEYRSKNFEKKIPLITHFAGGSPYRLEDLEPGEHRIKIYPVCVSRDQRSYRTTAKFTIQ